MEDKSVEIVVVNKRGSGSLSDTVPFKDMATLRVSVSEVMDQVDWSKVDVELTPSWDATAEEQQELNDIADAA